MEYFWQIPRPQKTAPGMISYCGEIWLLIVVSTDLTLQRGGI